MSKTPHDTSLQSTKQMLDELDALMERMLSLPVDNTEEAPAAVEPRPTLGAKLTMLTPPPLRPALSLQVPVASEPAKEMPPYNPPHFAPPAQASMPEPSPSPPPPFTNEVVPPTVMPTISTVLAETQPEAVSVTTEYGYLPLVWINLAFDAVVGQLPAGGLWRTTVGRMLLGFMGIALCAAAGAWLWKDWVGWKR